MIAPQIMGRLSQAEVTRARQDIRAIETALNVFRLDNYRYPTTDEGLQALVTNPGEAAAPNWQRGGYLKSIPLDPWRRPYLYLNPGQRGDFDIYTLGADGQEGGEDNNADIGNWNLN
jgi:general secretion pathway protein G